jgi:hypothetical protein
MSIFAGMSPQEAAAWVAGVIGVGTTLLNLWFTARAQKNKQTHEVSLEPLKTALMAKLEEHKSELASQSKLKDRLMEAELDSLRSALKVSQDLYAASIPLQQQVREHLATTRTLLGRVFVSFDRLARLAPALDEDDVLAETTNTLDLYAEYRQHLSSDKVVSYPAGLKSTLNEIQQVLARIFLDLQIDETSRNDPQVSTKMKASLSRLESLRDSGTAAIEQVIRIRLDSLQ